MMLVMKLVIWVGLPPLLLMKGEERDPLDFCYLTLLLELVYELIIKPESQKKSKIAEKRAKHTICITRSGLLREAS